MVLTEYTLILMLAAAFAVTIISYCMERVSKRRIKINAVDRLFDNVRFSEDKKSKTHFKKGLELLAKSYFLKNRVFKKAAKIFTKVAKNTTDPLDKAYALGWAGKCYQDYGDDELASKCYTAAISSAPSDIFSLEQLGDYFFSGLFTLEESEKHYQQILEYDPTSSKTYYKLAKLYTNNGDSDKAIDQYKNSIEVNNGYVAPMADAAIEYAKNGDKANSLKYYFLAMSNDVYEFEKLEEAIVECLS